MRYIEQPSAMLRSNPLSSENTRFPFRKQYVF